MNGHNYCISHVDSQYLLFTFPCYAELNTLVGAVLGGILVLLLALIFLFVIVIFIK